MSNSICWEKTFLQSLIKNLNNIIATIGVGFLLVIWNIVYTNQGQIMFPVLGFLIGVFIAIISSVPKKVFINISGVLFACLLSLFISTSFFIKKDEFVEVNGVPMFENISVGFLDKVVLRKFEFTALFPQHKVIVDTGTAQFDIRVLTQSYVNKEDSGKLLVSSNSDEQIQKLIRENVASAVERVLEKYSIEQLFPISTMGGWVETDGYKIFSARVAEQMEKINGLTIYVFVRKVYPIK